MNRIEAINAINNQLKPMLEEGDTVIFVHPEYGGEPREGKLIRRNRVYPSSWLVDYPKANGNYEGMWMDESILSLMIDGKKYKLVEE